MPAIASKPSSQTIEKGVPKRLPEIDWFRALAIGYMGVTHGEFHMASPPQWAAILALGGIYFCYVGFLMSFGMAQAIIFDRGLLLQPEGKARFLRQAGMILLGYYLIAFGGNLQWFLQMPKHQILSVVGQMLLLLNVPKAGDFFLSFLLYLLLILALPPLIKGLIQRPVLSLSAAVALNMGGNLLALHPLPLVEGWWKMLLGASPSARTFPVFGYAPLFVYSILLGWSYYQALDKPRWCQHLLVVALPIALLGNLLRSFCLHFPDTTTLHSLAALSPLPGLLYLVSASATATTIFCLISLICCRWASANSGPFTRFLTYVGRNSFWIIVWQYIWIGFLMDVLRLDIHSHLATVLYLIFLLFIPPLSLYLSQKLDAWYQGVTPNQKAHRKTAR